MADPWTVVAGLGAAVGGIGAAFGAFFASRSAKASLASSRDALDALAVGIRPYPRVLASTAGTPDALHAAVSVYNRRSLRSSWAVTDLVVEVRYRDGRVVRSTRERIDASPLPDQEGFELPWIVEIEDAKVTTPTPTEPWGESISEVIESVVLRYSDERGIARYVGTGRARVDLRRCAPPTLSDPATLSAASNSARNMRGRCSRRSAGVGVLEQRRRAGRLAAVQPRRWMRAGGR